MKRLGHDHVPGLQVRLWGSQGSDILSSLTHSKYQSVVTELEVRLREALDKCDAATAAHLRTCSDERTPHKLRTAVCCQLLQELSKMAGPFCGVLKTLCQELVRTPPDCQIKACPASAINGTPNVCSCATRADDDETATQVASIYSDCYASDVGSRLMDQLPYFAVAAKLEAENAHLEQRQAAFAQELAASKNMAMDVQLQLRVRISHARLPCMRRS